MFAKLFNSQVEQKEKGKKLRIVLTMHADDVNVRTVDHHSLQSRVSEATEGADLKGMEWRLQNCSIPKAENIANQMIRKMTRKENSKGNLFESKRNDRWGGLGP